MVNVSNKKVSESLPFLELYCHFIYRNYGRVLLTNKKFRNFFEKNIYNVKYEEIIKKSNLKLMPEEYFVSIYISIILMFLTLLLVTIIFFFINSAIAALIFYGGVIAVTAIGILLYNLPILKAKQRGREIDAAIPYLLPYMKILSKELSLAKILQIIDEFLIYKEIKKEFQKIKYYTSFLGNDILSSTRTAMLSCPSRQLSDLMNDLVNITNSGGDVYGYLDRKLENLLEEIDTIENKNIETLLIFSQIYVVLLLISPLFYTIMVAILSLIQVGGEGIASPIVSIMILIVFLPVAYFIFMMLVYFSKPLYSRLIPIQNEI